MDDISNANKSGRERSMARKARQAFDGDEVTVIEAAYRLDGDRSEWLTNLARSAAPLLDRGFGVAAFTAQVNEAGLRVHDAASFGGSPDLPAAVTAFISGADPVMMAKAFSTGPCTTMAASAGGSMALGADPASEAMFRAGIFDALGVLGADGTPFIMGLSAFLPEVTSLNSRFRKRWARIATHLSAAFRVRRALESLKEQSPKADVLSEAEAILAPSGAVAHAESHAQRATATLGRAVVAMERARFQLRHHDSDAAVEAWRGLVAGRWSLLEHFDSDGRRFLVARKNDADVGGPSVLSPRERQVLAARARGMSFKLISYDLGVSLAAVSKYLLSGMQKLGLANEMELVAVFSGMPAPR